VVEQVPAGVAWSLSVGRFWARWGALAVLTEDRWGRSWQRFRWGPANDARGV